jgi:hypothetical protein
MLPSPLLFGGNPARLDNDAWTLALLTNEEVLAVNQDALGARGVRKAVTGGEMWVRELSGGRKAVAFFNRGNTDATEDTEPAARVTGPVFHLHLHLSDAAVSGISPVVRVECPGRRLPVPFAVVEQWLAAVAPGTVLTVTPVGDANEHIAVDQYEVPPRLSRQVSETQFVCVFPWCGRRGRYDLDHIIEYVDPDEGGPPGQTSSTNLARLCRFHHRVKTHSAWTSRRLPDGALHWTSPAGATYRVDPSRH